MKLINQYNHRYNKRIGISIVVTVSIIIGVGLIYFPMYINQIMRNVQEEAIMTLENVSSQNKKILQNVIKDKQDIFLSLAMQLEQEQKYNVQEIIKQLKIYQQIHNIHSMGIINKEGICHNTLDEVLDLGKYDYFKKGMDGKSEVTHSYVAKDGQTLINMFTTPIYKKGEVEMLLITAYESGDFSKMLNINSFDGNGKSIVVTPDAQLITSPAIETMHLEEHNAIHKEKEEIAKVVLDNLSTLENHVLTFEYKGESYLAHYEELGINDWHLISYVPKNYLYNNIDQIKSGIYKGGVMIYFTCLAIFIIFIVEHIRYKKRMMNLIFFDSLTGEKNNEYLTHHFEYMSEEEKAQHCLVVMDIDKFKSINMIYGSQVGDRLLKYIPRIFKEILPEEKIFKYQGDVFVALFKETSQEKVIDKIQSIEQRINEDIEKKLIVPMKLYFGVCGLNEFTDLHSVYNNALIAKNEAKKSVNQTIRFLNHKDKDKILANRKIELDFLDALKNNEFEVWYQPKYNMKTGKIYGAEALVRWRKKEGNFIGPADFIPVLENTGQIIQLDEAVIKMVFQDIQIMKQEGLPIKPISINLSRIQVTNKELVNKIKLLMEEYKVNPHEISFEITETALVEDSDSINRIIAELHEIGVKVDMDDYGMGNSTVNDIFTSNFDTLKLDKTFCDHIGHSKMNVIIKSTIKMAKELCMTVIAEGVETKEQMEFLMENDCQIGQGYYFSKPLTREDYFGQLKNQ